MTPEDATQRAQALDITQHVIVRAPAGSGKTELLVQRCLAALAVASEPESVVAITFTVKAANEIRQRLYSALERGTGEAPAAEHALTTWQLAKRVLERDEAMGWGLLVNPARLQALTIDALNARLIRQLPILSGLGGPIDALDNPYPAYEQAVTALFEEYENDSLDTDVRAALEQVLVFADNSLDRLMPMFVSMLEKREQWRDLLGDAGDTGDEQAVLTALVGQRVNDLVDVLPVEAWTLIAIADSVSHANTDWAAALHRSSGRSPGQVVAWQGFARTLLTTLGDWRAKLTKREGFAADDPQTPDARAALEALKGHPDSETVRERLVSMMTLPVLEYPEYADTLRRALSQTLSRCVAHLMLSFHAEAGVDFSEIALRAAAALRGGASEDMSVMSRQNMLIEHLLVDEYQDTSTLQNELIASLVEAWDAEEGRSLFLVGDPQQSIYGFRQAEVREFMSIWENAAFAGLPLTCLTLTQNFRSRPAVVDGCNNILAAGFPSIGDRDNGVVSLSRSKAARDPEAGAGVWMHRVDYEDWTDEAERVAGLVAERLEEKPGADVAILTRAKSHVARILEALAARGIAYASQDLNTLTGRGPAADAIALIRALWHAADRGSWVELLRSPLVGLSHADLVLLCRNALYVPIPSLLADDERMAMLSDDGRQRVARLMDAIEAARADVNRCKRLDRLAGSVWLALDGPACMDATAERDVERVFDVLAEHCVAGQLESLERFTAQLNRLFANTSEGRVQVMTIHKAKGLEFDTVFLVGTGRGTASPDRPLLHRVRTRHGVLTVPRAPRFADKKDPTVALYEFAHVMATSVQRNESMRLLYVAMTRAKSQLHVVVNLKGDRPEKSTLVEPVWDALVAYEQAPPALTLSKVDDKARFVPCPPRLPAGHACPLEGRDILAPAIKSTSPSERVFKAAPVKQHSVEDGETARIIGIMYHRVMETRARRAAPLDFEPSELRAALVAMARREGMPEPDVARAAGHVIEMLDRTRRCKALADEVFKAGRSLVSEYHYTGQVGGRWTTGIIDLVSWSSQAERTIWVLDYKASVVDPAITDRAGLIAGLVVRYRGQLVEYADAVRALNPGFDVRTALFIPAFGHLEVVDTATEEAAA
ncbi:UvrD-helicase domain-containing protein [Endozoicomonas sp. G2_2]|uniref:UvrD-helicase domain-containing protein n=1 Tax=Endozoicomonas sp. G2_2 TaxID=2821092 RepID=UPI001ADADBE7|nr:UvrD-helicase domain-containing protein [Endozoicomonas sp. G2_2]MBO9471083.1 UvrD-helicase domain-containing protein [Endozoicomonas sp. G2_2]